MGTGPMVPEEEEDRGLCCVVCNMYARDAHMYMCTHLQNYTLVTCT